MSYAHSATARAVLESLVPVVCPPEAHALAADIVAHMALTIDASPVIIQKGFAAGLLAYDLGALPRYFKRASKLTGDKAEAYFASWEHGITPLQVQLAKAINQLMSLSCYEMPAMMERVGFRPAPWIEEVRERRLTVYRDDARRQEAQILAPDPLRPGVKIGQQKKARVA
jgi:hypothetical protein